MQLSYEDLKKLARGEPVEVSEQLFSAPDPRLWPDDPDLRRAVDWLKGYVGDDWSQRRLAAFARLYASAIGDLGFDGKGQFFDTGDTFGWYLFLGEAALDHAWNFEPMYGSRVVPLLRAIGRSMPLLTSIPGIADRVQRLVGAEKRQPNGTLFELLVAAAYRRAGAEVAFRPEAPGKHKTYDLDVTVDGVTWAVECKRMETSEYGEQERMRMRELWRPSSDLVEKLGLSVFADLVFKVPVAEVPNGYLLEKAEHWLSSGLPSLLWQDDVASGVIGEMDLKPLQSVLETDDVLISGTRVLELLTGRYRRHENHIQGVRFKYGASPRYMDACDQAIVLRWKCIAEASVNAKAKDVVAKLAQATAQLPNDRPGTVHVGLEAVEGDESEAARIARVLKSLEKFDPRGKPLEFVYVHYFLPDSPPGGGWDFEERVDWRRISGEARKPLSPAMLVILPDDNH